MSTFAEVRSFIADDLDRSDLTTQINRAINRAIEHYEKERFFFNEAIGTFTTTASQKAYTTATIPSDILEIDYVEVVVSGNDYKLTERPYTYIEEIDVSHQTGIPTDYAYYDEQIFLYPIPDDAYTIRISYQKLYSELSADNDTNDFTEEAEDLIECHALAWIYSRILKNDKEAMKYESLEIRALDALRAKTTKLKTVSGPITPTEF